jgi:hypothetical protein
MGRLPSLSVSFLFLGFEITWYWKYACWPSSLSVGQLFSYISVSSRVQILVYLWHHPKLYFSGR